MKALLGAFNQEMALVGAFSVIVKPIVKPMDRFIALISGHYKKKWLRSTIRICFHERRLQYIEAEQIAEWSRSHPNERILEIDM